MGEIKKCKRRFHFFFFVRSIQPRMVTVSSPSFYNHLLKRNDKVCLTKRWNGEGPLQSSEQGTLLKNRLRTRPHDPVPYYVEAPNGMRWWYRPYEIKKCPLGKSHRKRKQLSQGTHVCPTKQCQKRGPLQSEKLGVVVSYSHVFHMYYVRGFSGQGWWYHSQEIRSCSSIVHKKAPVVIPPVVGDKVCLTVHWRHTGPLMPGQQGVVVTHLHRYKPYRVRAPNGQLWWYYDFEIKRCPSIRKKHEF